MYKNEYLDKCYSDRVGSGYLLRGHKDSIQNKCDELIIEDLGFMCNHPEELEEFKTELIKANIKEFIITESSSALMRNLHSFNEIGIKMNGVVNAKYIDRWEDIEGTKQGLRMIVE